MAQDQQQQQQQQAQPVEKPRILVVEDDKFLRNLYVEILENEGYQVDSAEDGGIGFTKMKQGGWNLVLLDIVLPKMDGLQIMQKLQTDKPDMPNKRVLFLTNLDNDAHIKQALALGDGYLIKSQVTPGSLLQEVKTYLSKY